MKASDLRVGDVIQFPHSSFRVEALLGNKIAVQSAPGRIGYWNNSLVQSDLDNGATVTRDGVQIWPEVKE